MNDYQPFVQWRTYHFFFAEDCTLTLTPRTCRSNSLTFHGKLTVYSAGETAHVEWVAGMSGFAWHKKTEFLGVTSVYAELTKFRLITSIESVQKHKEAIC